MSYGSFTNKTAPPDLDRVREMLGLQTGAWDCLVTTLAGEYHCRSEWKFYGKNYGWALCFKKGGKSIASLYPADGFFTVQVVLPESRVTEALSGRLSEEVKHAIFSATPFREGRWVFVPVRNEDLLRDSRSLIGLKSL
jgi:hypothetical protein